MKNGLVVCVSMLLLFYVTTLSAQVRDSTSSRPSLVETTTKTNDAAGHFTTSLNIFSSGWTDVPQGIGLKPVSLGYSAYVHYKANLWNPYITFFIGAGVSYNDYRFNGKLFYTENFDSTYFEPMQPTAYKRNKMSLVFVEAPIELRFATASKDKGVGWYIMPGFSGGLLINDYMKTVSEDANGHTTKQKIYYTRNLADYRYGVSLKLGYGPVGLYGYYGLTELFESGKGFGTNIYQVGITLGTN